MNETSGNSTLTTLLRQLRMVVIVAMLAGMIAPLAQPTTMYAAPNANPSAASVSKAEFTAGGTFINGTYYAKNGASLTLTVTTDADTKCVELTGAHVTQQTSGTAKTSWTFALTANEGSGVQTVSTTAYKNANPQGKCTGEKGEALGLQSASYTLDNTGPVVTGTVVPAANAAGWSKADATITWTATDAGSGVATGPTPATDTVTTDTAGVSKTATATDKVGNSATGSVTVKLDKIAPTLRVTRSPAANAKGWNNSDVTVSFTCADELSGIKSCTGGGTQTLTKEGANQSVPGTAVDNADNTFDKGIGNINIDKTPPVLTGGPTTDPNSDGWYKGDVTIKWTARDDVSGLDGATPADSVIGTSGKGLVEYATVTDLAGNTTRSASTPVNIDRMAPDTKATAPANWNNVDVTVLLEASDNLSGVKTTYYKLDGVEKTGTSVAISAEGTHTLQYWSVDAAGNVEEAKSITVKIDKTSPTINHTQNPEANAKGWNNTDVVVTFTCADTGGSAIASCTAPQTITTEGKDQAVTGTAKDAAGNTATDPATVSIDKTRPTINPKRDRLANDAGWYKDDVTISFECLDAGNVRSGIDVCPAPQTFGEGANQAAGGTVTDAAGNSAEGGITGINVDKTAPMLTGAPTAPANGDGWYKADVTVAWTCSDALSAVTGDCPPDDTIRGEGANLSASASISDRAGNTTNTTVGNIQIDRTAPATSASVPAPLASGWYAGAVKVTLNAVDTLSGPKTTFYSVDGGKTPQVYNGPFDFATKGVTTLTFWSVDKAGNTETAGLGLTIKIDDIAPSTTASLPASLPSGWYADVVPVAFAGTDLESGMKEIRYTVNGGEEQVFDGTLTVDAIGTNTINFWGVDVAGNVEDKTAPENKVVVKFDNLPPTIEGSRTPAANAHGWNNTDVTVKFVCNDPVSGLADIAGCTPDTPVTNEAAGQQVTGDAVDNAGNRASTTVKDINIDKTAPTLTGAATTAANAAGWYKGNVVIVWTGQDGLSGIDTATQPANSQITGEGDNLATSATITDKAGNVGNGSVGGIKVDRTAPTISGAATTPPNGAGWYNGPVTVKFTCADTLSGVQECASDALVNSDGTNLSATGRATDLADNEAMATVGGIKIDSKSPTSEADIQCEGKNNFCRGAKATIALSAADQDGLSGVKEMRYSTDAGKTWTTLAGATGSFDITLNRSGKVSIQFRAVDNAGNEETANVIEVKYDTIAPTVSHKLDPEANAAGWTRADTTVTFSAEDDSDGSGVDPATLTKPVVVNAETAGQVVNGEASDLAGNKGNDSVTVKLDKTVPTISGAATTAPNGAGWYNGPVTVKFTPADALSGIAGTVADVVLTTNGASQSVSGTATDLAGNTASATVGGINIDAVKPAITVGGVAPGGIYILGAVPAATCEATDADSGLDGACSVTVTGGTANGVGTYTYTATAKDKAGNTGTVTGTYTVKYNVQQGTAFFLPPINDTAHTTGTTTSVFKASSTVPVKFQLKDANGKIVQANTAPEWLTPAKGSATTAPADETVYSDPATTGTTYKWDATSQQYIYNWSTKGVASGFYYRVGVKLDDGQIYTVNIGLR